jgi:hypothetical protein
MDKESTLLRFSCSTTWQKCGSRGNKIQIRARARFSTVLHSIGLKIKRSMNCTQPVAQTTDHEARRIATCLLEFTEVLETWLRPIQIVEYCTCSSNCFGRLVGFAAARPLSMGYGGAGIGRMPQQLLHSRFGAGPASKKKPKLSKCSSAVGALSLTPWREHAQSTHGLHFRPKRFVSALATRS